MKKFRKLSRCLAISLLCIITLFAMVSCGGGSASEKGNTWEGDGTGKIVVSYLTMINEPAELKKVESAINAKTKAELGIEIEWLPISVTEQSKYTTLIGGGTQIDLMCLCLTDPRPYAEVSMIKRINDANIEKFAPNIKNLCDDGYSLEVLNERGDVIGFSTLERQLGIGGSFIVRKSDLEKVGLAETYTDQKQISYSDLDVIFEALKEEYPTSYPCGNVSPVPGMFMATDTMGTDITLKSSGVLNLSSDINTTTIVNFYEMPEYKAYVEKMQEWNSKGYINPDALTQGESSINLFGSGKSRGAYIDCWLSLRDEYSTRVGEEVVQLQLQEPYYVAQTAGNGNTWAVGGTAKNPAAALRLMDALMTDQELMNMFQWGIEGEHFEIVDNEVGVITFPEGLTAGTSGFYNTLGLYGNKNLIYAFLTEGQTIEDIRARNEAEALIVNKAITRSSPANGFVYDSSRMTNEIYAVEAVIGQYAASVGVGQSDKYDEFISELKKAGIEDIIADKQSQFDAWRNSK